MEIGLPPLFAHRLNVLDQALIEYLSAYKEESKQEAMAKIFVISCEIMNSLDIPKLGEDMREVFKRREAPSTSDDEMFDAFLDLENLICEKIGLENPTRSRISEYIANLKAIREYEGAIGYLSQGLLDFDGILQNIQKLKAEVCSLARTALSKLEFKVAESKMAEERRSWRAKVVNISCSVFGVGVTVINTAAGLAGFMTADAAAYSMGAGATLIAFRK